MRAGQLLPAVFQGTCRFERPLSSEAPDLERGLRGGSLRRGASVQLPSWGGLDSDASALKSSAELLPPPPRQPLGVASGSAVAHRRGRAHRGPAHSSKPARPAPPAQGGPSRPAESPPRRVAPWLRDRPRGGHAEAFQGELGAPAAWPAAKGRRARPPRDSCVTPPRAGAWHWRAGRVRQLTPAFAVRPTLPPPPAAYERT